MPATIEGSAIGSSTRSSLRAGPKPIPRAASTTSGGTSARPVTVLRTSTTSVYSASATCAVRADSPVRDLPALVALGRERQLTFGSAGPNSLPQLAVWRVQRAAGNLDFTHVPYRGDPPHLNELLGGRLDFSSTVVASASELIDSGRLRLIAVFSRRRHPDYPDVPTAREQGLDAEQFSQVGIYAPRGTPEPVLDRLEEVCRTGLDDPAFRRVAASSRVVVNFMPRRDFARMVDGEFANYARLLRDLGVRAE